MQKKGGSYCPLLIVARHKAGSLFYVHFTITE